MSLFPWFKVMHGDRLDSDHFSIVVYMDSSDSTYRNNRSPIFRFEEERCKNDDCAARIRQNWVKGASVTTNIVVITCSLQQGNFMGIKYI